LLQQQGAALPHWECGIAELTATTQVNQAPHSKL